MITCRELAELLYDLTSGDLAPEETLQVEEHLRQCGCCATYEETYRLTIEMTRRLPRPALPAHLAEKLRGLLVGCQIQANGRRDG
jgi:anti-sigma factor RsiW